VTLSIEPFSSKSRLKNWAVSMLTPIAANTIAKLSSSPPPWYVKKKLDQSTSNDSARIKIGPHVQIRTDYYLCVLAFLQPLDKTSLTANLSSNFIMRKPSSRKERNLLPSSNGVHDVNGRYPCLNHLLRVGSLTWVNGTS
jgi:hypothetical protein